MSNAEHIETIKRFLRHNFTVKQMLDYLREHTDLEEKECLSLLQESFNIIVDPLKSKMDTKQKIAYEEMQEIFCEATNYCVKSKTPNSIVEHPIDSETGLPIVREKETLSEKETEESKETEEKPTYYEEFWEMMNKEFKCPVCGEIFDTIPAFLKHWQEKHEEKYGIYKDFRKVKYKGKEPLTDQEILSIWLKHYRG